MRRRRNFHNKHKLVEIVSLNYLDVFIKDGIECLKGRDLKDGLVEVILNRKPYFSEIIKATTLVSVRIQMKKYKVNGELLDLIVMWFKDIADRADHLTTGNVAHNKAYIGGVARRAAEYVTKHSVELKEE